MGTLSEASYRYCIDGWRDACVAGRRRAGTYDTQTLSYFGVAKVQRSAKLQRQGHDEQSRRLSTCCSQLRLLYSGLLHNSIARPAALWPKEGFALAERLVVLTGLTFRWHGDRRRVVCTCQNPEKYY